MTRLVLQMGISVDGFVALPDGSQPWLGERENDAAKQWKLETVRGTDAHLAGFARALIRHRLVDEYRLNIQPAALGAGMPIFTEMPEPVGLELVEARAFGSGSAGHVYVPRTP